MSNDEEYTISIPSKEKRAAMVLNLLWRDDPDFDADNITFGYVGKESPAHKKALAVYQRRAKADRTLKADDLLKQIIG